MHWFGCKRKRSNFADDDIGNVKNIRDFLFRRHCCRAQVVVSISVAEVLTRSSYFPLKCEPLYRHKLRARAAGPTAHQFCGWRSILVDKKIDSLHRFLWEGAECCSQSSSCRTFFAAFAWYAWCGSTKLQKTFCNFSFGTKSRYLAGFFAV